MSQDDVGRFLLIFNVPHFGNGESLAQVIQTIAPYKDVVDKHLKTEGWVIVTFYDSRDAKIVADYLTYRKVLVPSGELIQLRCVRVNKDTVRAITGIGDNWIWQDSESTIKVDVQRNLRGVGVDGMEKCLAHFGELKLFEVYEPHGKSFGAEFWNTCAAASAINTLNGQPLDDGGVLRVRYLTETPSHSTRVTPPISTPVGTYRRHSSLSYALGLAEYEGRSEPASYATSPSNLSAPVSPTEANSLNLSFDRLSLQSNSYQTASSPRVSPPRRLTSTLGDGEGYKAPQERQFGRGHQIPEHPALQGLLNQNIVTARAGQQRPYAVPRWSKVVDRQAIPPKNLVYPERIEAGVDTQTTVMIKNVPNKLSRQELVDILQQVVPHEFDFVYLRFDFNNHCNVGYAFVNFTSCNALLQFIKAKVGKKWNLFSSEKVLQVSYANIQGKAALVNKFHNSAVMNVIEGWRPQIFYGALKGQPEPFPKPDNYRSVATRRAFFYGGGLHCEGAHYDHAGY